MTKQAEQDLRHALGNAQAEIEALKSILGKAADHLEEVAESGGSEAALAKALAMAQRLRTVIARAEGKTDGAGSVPITSGGSVQSAA